MSELMEPQLSAEEARTLTEQIRTAAGATWELVVQAFKGRAWAALGYASWDSYVTGELGSSRLRLPREQREEVVSSLRSQGLSYPAIAAATGISQSTAHDAAAGFRERNPSEPEVTGTDGKSYPPRDQKPRKRRRPALDKAARTASDGLLAAMLKVDRVLDDDRYPDEMAEVAAIFEEACTYTRAVCDRILNDLANTVEGI